VRGTNGLPRPLAVRSTPSIFIALRHCPFYERSV
jgi:hypothetical protein